MGLDMLFMKSPNEADESINGRKIGDEGDEAVAHLRKHPNLHGWMQELWEGRGGVIEDWTSFNNADCVELSKDSLTDLKRAVEEDNLPETTGFFFGESVPEQKGETLEVIQQCLAAIEEGYHIYYTSWW